MIDWNIPKTDTRHHRVRRRERFGLMVLGLAGLGLAAQATQGPPTPVEELVRRAEFVIHGRVESVETLEAPVGRRFTRVELSPIEVWKGGATNRLGLVLASGVLGERWVKVVGEPEYRPGEEVVVFTVPNDRGEAVTLDLSQGKFAVTGSGNAKLASNGMIGGTPEPGRVRLPHQVPLSLEALRERVRRAVAAEVTP